MGGRKRKYRRFACDFETTVYDEQTLTEVWASAVLEIVDGAEPIVFHSIDETYEYFINLRENLILYYHNLKFDGSFWIYFLENVVCLKQAYHELNESGTQVEFEADADMQNDTYKYMISARGQWYSIVIRKHDKYIVINDSLKLLPFTLKQIGESFKTKHQKLEMEYKGRRYAGCEITPEEMEYIKNDVYVLAEGLSIMFADGHEKTTIGACCLAEYKEIVKRSLHPAITEWDIMYPNLYDVELTGDYGENTVGDYIKHSYRGGWCYLVPEKACKIYTGGITADVNSLYSSVMHSKSGSRYPIGLPKFFRGTIPDEALKPDKYYFVRIRTRFYIKPGKLPFIQIKGNHLYRGTESLTTSDIYNPKDDRYYTEYIDINGFKRQAKVVLTLTMTDYILIKEHYELVECEILDGCYFSAVVGIFDEYIDKYMSVKQNNKGAKRTEAKLFLNNLYGKMATSTDSSFKVAFTNPQTEALSFFQVEEHEKIPGYIPIGSAITSYARNFTIRAAQKNYHGPDKPGFIYADTDSIHCDLPAEELVGVPVHPTELCHWKLESSWDIGWFIRQKTYIEHVTAEDLEQIDNPYYNVKCAGMPTKCKNLFLESVERKHRPIEELTEEEADFLYENGQPINRTIEDFNIGLIVPGKLIPKQIPGGVLLVETSYEMR